MFNGHAEKLGPLKIAKTRHELHTLHLGCGEVQQQSLHYQHIHHHHETRRIRP